MLHVLKMSWSKIFKRVEIQATSKNGHPYILWRQDLGVIWTMQHKSRLYLRIAIDMQYWHSYNDIGQLLQPLPISSCWGYFPWSAASGNTCTCISCLWSNKNEPYSNRAPLLYTTVVPHLYGPQLYGSPDYSDPILPDIHMIFDVH